MEHGEPVPPQPSDGGTEPQTATPRAIASRQSFMSVPAHPSSTSQQPASNPVKRPRGRPRKYHASSSPLPKVPMRSKTGCLPCRAVKKKCDEARPICGRCRANGFECTSPLSPGVLGEPSSRDQADSGEVSYSGSFEGQAEPLSVDSSDPTSTAASKSDMDNFIADQVEPPGAFGADIDGTDGSSIDNLLQYHLNNALTRSFCHVVYRNSLGHTLLQMASTGSPDSYALGHALLWLSCVYLSVSNGKSPEVEDRLPLHYGFAIKVLRKKIHAHRAQKATDDTELDDQGVALTLVLCLDSLITGQADAQYTSHLDGLRIILESMSTAWPSTPFRRCVVDFYIFHKASNAFTSLSQNPLPQPAFFDMLNESTLVGTLKYCFMFHFRTCALRRKIRQRRRLALVPTLDAELLAEAAAIQATIDGVEPSNPSVSSQDLMFALSCECGRAFLLRTTMLPPVPTPELKAAVDAGIAIMAQLQQTNAPFGTALMAVFMLGVAAFEDAQRTAITALFEVPLQQRTPEAIARATEILHCLWALMDQRSDEAWDWEAVIKERMGLDYLLA